VPLPLLHGFLVPSVQRISPHLTRQRASYGAMQGFYCRPSASRGRIILPADGQNRLQAGRIHEIGVKRRANFELSLLVLKKNTFYSFLRRFTKFTHFLPNFTKFLPNFTKFYHVLPNLAKIYHMFAKFRGRSGAADSFDILLGRKAAAERQNGSTIPGAMEIESSDSQT
jgi:hypothetical protein